MFAALALSIALVGQQESTMVYRVDGTIQQFHLYWDFTGTLWLDLEGATIKTINSKTPPGPVSITFDQLQLHPLPDPTLTPYLCHLSNQSGVAILSYDFTSIGFGTGPGAAAVLSFEFIAATRDQMLPYTFDAFGFGAYEQLMLYPASGDIADIQAVVNRKTLSVSGSGVFVHALWPWNAMIHDSPNFKVFWPAY